MVGFEVFDTRQQYYYDMSQAGASVKVGRRLKWPDDYFYIQGCSGTSITIFLDGAGVYPNGITHQYTLGATISRKNIDNPCSLQQVQMYVDDSFQAGFTARRSELL